MKTNLLNNLAVSSISLIFFVFSISVILFFFGISLSAVNFLLANITSYIVVSIILKDFKTTLLTHFFNFIIIYFLALYFKGTMDFTADSLWYHIPAINRILHGWIITDLKTLDVNTFFAIENYPKASWIINAALAKFFSNFEASKLLGVYLIYSSFLFCLLTGIKYKLFEKKYLTALFALAAAFNTVSVVQSHTFLVDGVLSSLIIIMLCAITLFIKEKKYTYLLMYALSLCLLINVKLTGGVYGGILTLGALVIIDDKANRIQIASVFAITAILSAFFLGYNPYTTNTLTHKNPVYPLLSSKEKEYYKDQAPQSIRNMPSPIRLLASITAQSGAKFDSVKYKLPFTITKRDIDAAGSPQTGTGSFGIWFSGLLLLSLAALTLLRNEKYFYKLIIVLVFLMLSVLINAECWWARFVPQLTLFPIFVLFYSALIKNKKITYVLLTAVIVNMILTSGLYIKKTYKYQKDIRELTSIIRYFGKVKINANDDRIEGIRIRMQNIGVDINETSELKCRKNRYLKYATIPVCLIK